MGIVGNLGLFNAILTFFQLPVVFKLEYDKLGFELQ